MDQKVAYIFKALDQFSAPLKKMQKGLNDFSSKLDTLDKNNKIYAQSLKKLGDGMIGFGKKASLYVTAPIIGLTYAVANAVMEAEKMDKKFEAFFGNDAQAKEFLGTIDDLRRGMGAAFESDQLEAGAFSLLKAGMAAKDIAKNMEHLTDIAIGSGMSIEELSRTFGMLKMKGTTATRALNTMTRKQIPIVKQLSKQFGVSEKAIVAMAKDGKISIDHLNNALLALSETDQRFIGQSEKGANTLTAQIGVLKEEFAKLFEAIGFGATEGAGLIDVVRGISVHVKNMTLWIENFTAQNPQMAKFLVISTAILAAVGPLGIALGMLAKGVAFFLVPALWAVNLAFKAIMKHPVVALISFLGMAFLNLYQTNENFRNGINSTFSTLYDWAMKVLGPISELFNKMNIFSGDTPFVGGLAGKLFGSDESAAKMNKKEVSESNATLTLNVNDKGGLVKSTDFQSSGPMNMGMAMGGG